MNEISRSVLWMFISLNIMPSSLIHIATNDRISLLWLNSSSPDILLYFLYPFFCFTGHFMLIIVTDNKHENANVISTSWFHFLLIKYPEVGLLDHRAAF